MSQIGQTGSEVGARRQVATAQLQLKGRQGFQEGANLPAARFEVPHGGHREGGPGGQAGLGEAGFLTGSGKGGTEHWKESFIKRGAHAPRKSKESFIEKRPKNRLRMGKPSLCPIIAKPLDWIKEQANKFYYCVFGWLV